MHFFEKQKYDDAGIIGVKIQKLVLFLMVARFVAYIFSWNINLINLIGTFTVFLFLFLGFWGSYKRNVRMLQCYYITNVVVIVASAVLVAFVVIPMLLHAPDQTNYPPVNDPSFNSTVPDSSVTQPDAPTDETNTTEPLNVSLIANDTSSSDIPNYHFGLIEGAVILLAGIISIAMFVIRIITIIFAAKMVRLLKEKQAQSLAHPTKGTQSYHPMTQIMPNTMYIQVPVQPNTVPFEYYPHQFAQQPMVFNPYLQPYRPQNV